MFGLTPDNQSAYIGLGSNLGDRAGNLLLAVRCMMEASFDVCKLSAIYETEPWEMESDLWFLNMVAQVKLANDISPTQMMARLLRIEYNLGRRDKMLNLPRTIDLDLLFFGKMRLQTDFLTLPHPCAHERRFVLTPLNEIAPHLVHPGIRRTIAELLADCEDDGKVRRWHPSPSQRACVTYEP